MIHIDRDWLFEQYVTLGKSIAVIAQEKDVSKGTINHRLKKFEIERRPRSQNFEDLTGRRYGDLVVESLADKGGKRCTRWNCLCDCGTRKVIARSSLVHALTRSCGCYRITTQWKGSGQLSGCYWSRVIRGAEKRGLQVDVTIEQAWDLFVAQEGRCAMSGLPIQIVADLSRNWNEHTASLDRIHNDRGYCLDNIQWVHRDINMMRRDLGVDQFVEYCRRIAEHHGVSSTPDRRAA